MFEPPIRTTLCGHNFCERCLMNIKSDREEWRCPECQHAYSCSIETIPRAYLLEKMVEKFKAKQQEQLSNFFGNCRKHNRAIEVSKLFRIGISPKSILLKNLWFSGCLEHANDICADCSFQNLCGNQIKSDQCNFIKLSDMKKLVQDETTKIKGIANFDLGPNVDSKVDGPHEPKGTVQKDKSEQFNSHRGLKVTLTQVHPKLM